MPDQKPRVTHVITTVARGGAENHLLELIAGQQTAGWEISLAFLKPDGDRFWQPRLEAMGVRTYDLHLTRYGSLPPARRLKRFLKEMNPSLVHAHMPPAELYVRLALLGWRLPMIVSKHLDKTFFDGPGTHLLERWCTGRASRVIAISNAVSRYFREAWDASLAARLRTIHYGIDPTPYLAVEDAEVQALRRGWGADPSDYVIGTAARLVPQKALDVMIRGFAGAVKAVPEKRMRLIIVGRGPLRLELERLAQQLGISDRVVFAGYCEDVPQVMRAFDVFALTSDFEGFGLALLEAMAAGRAVLATAASAIPEVVADGQTGILVPRQDVSAVTEAMVKLADPTLRDSLGEAGRRRVFESFSPQAMVRKTIEVYEEVLHEHRK